MNGATQKIEQLENDRLSVTELVQVKFFFFFSFNELILFFSKQWIQ
jgi:hypothetical protein